MKNAEDLKYERARKRVAQLKSYYIHLGVYVVINAFILANLYIKSGYDNESFWDWKNFTTAFFWGIGLLFHTVCTFGIIPVYSSKWEDRKIKEFMARDKAEKEKYL